MKSFKQFLREAWIHMPKGFDVEANYIFSKGGIGDPDSPTATKELVPTDNTRGTARTTRHSSWLNTPENPKGNDIGVLVSSRVRPLQKDIEYIFRHATDGSVLARTTTQVHDDTNESDGNPRLTTPTIIQHKEGVLTQAQMDSMILDHRNAKIGYFQRGLNASQDTMSVKDFHIHNLGQIMNNQSKPPSPQPPPEDFEDKGYYGPGDGDSPF